MAGFVRLAAEEQAQLLIERETRLSLSEHDFAEFTRTLALDQAFTPNPALEQALQRARSEVRRA